MKAARTALISSTGSVILLTNNLTNVNMAEIFFKWFNKETAEKITEEGRKSLREAMDKLNEIHGFAESAAEKMEDLNRSVEKANKIGQKYGF